VLGAFFPLGFIALRHSFLLKMPPQSSRMPLAVRIRKSRARTPEQGQTQKKGPYPFWKIHLK
jgi:hypothetical protein